VSVSVSVRKRKHRTEVTGATEGFRELRTLNAVPLALTLSFATDNWKGNLIRYEEKIASRPGPGRISIASVRIPDKPQCDPSAKRSATKTFMVTPTTRP
jgi:hypothetical protein